MMRDQERARHELLARLEEILGPDEAATLMENLPPQPWSELATKADVGVLKADVAVLKADVGVLKADVDVLKSDVGTLKADVADLRFELGSLRTEMRAGFAHLGEVLDLRFAAQDARFEAFVRERIDSQTKLLVFAFVGALLTTAGIALGSVAL
jgi:hypothetical protein